CRLNHFAGRDKCGLPPLGFGEGGGELLSDRPFLLPRIAGKVPQSDLSVRVKHRATGEGVGRTAPPRLLSPTPRVAIRAQLRHIRHGLHLLCHRHSAPPATSVTNGNRSTCPTRSRPGSTPGLASRIVATICPVCRPG